MTEILPIFNALRRAKAGALMLLFQIAITMAIVSNAAFIIHDRLTYLKQDTGYPEQDIFHFRVMSFGENPDFNQRFRLDEQRIREIPGVLEVSTMSAVPMTGSGSSSGFSVVPEPETGRQANAAYLSGNHTILQTLGLTISEGRNFTEEDVVVTDTTAVTPNVAIVSRPFLNALYPEGDGLGKVFYRGVRPVKIVGVVENMRGPWLHSDVAENVILFPYLLGEARQRFAVRTRASERAGIMRQIEDLLLEQDNQRVIVDLQGLDEAKAEYNASDTLMLRMLIVLIAVLVSVTALGNFGLTLFNISKRTRQIGTRRALGARKSHIVRYFLLENTMVCLAGLLLGGLGAVVLGQQLMKLYSLPALESHYVLATAVFILLVSLLAVIVPARRAANIAPSIATRSI